METKKQYKNPKDYVTPKQASKSFGTLKESPSKEKEVVELKGPDGTVLVWKEDVERYQDVWAEMEVKKAVKDTEEEEGS